MLSSKTVLVAGGVGTVGRGIARGLLNSGARVICNSRSDRKLRRLDDDLGNPANLILIHGTMIPYDPSSEHTFAQIFSQVGPDSIDHVVSHCGVRWWDRTADESGIIVPSSTDNVIEMSLEEYQAQSRYLSDFQWNVARKLMPTMSGRNTSFTFVTGAPLDRSNSDLAKMNVLGVHSLAATLRARASRGQTGQTNIRELRVAMQVGRSAVERAKDPREVPLSADIGDICAGIISAPGDVSSFGDIYKMSSAEEKDALLQQFPVSEKIDPEIPIMWNFQHAA